MSLRRSSDSSPLFWQVRNLATSSNSSSSTKLKSLQQLHPQEGDVLAQFILSELMGDLTSQDKKRVQQIAEALTDSSYSVHAITSAFQALKPTALNRLQDVLLASGLSPLKRLGLACVLLSGSDSLHQVGSSILDNTLSSLEKQFKSGAVKESQRIEEIRKTPIALLHCIVSTLQTKQNQLDKVVKLYPELKNTIEVAPMLLKQTGVVDGVSKSTSSAVGSAEVLGAVAISEVIKEWGFTVTRSKESLRQAMDPVLNGRKLEEADVAQVLAMMSTHNNDTYNTTETEPYNTMEQSFSSLSTNKPTTGASKHSKQWNVDVFIQTCMQYNGNLNADHVVRCLDLEALQENNLSAKGFELILLGVRQLSKQDRMNGDMLTGDDWIHKSAQLNLLAHALNTTSGKVMFPTGMRQKKSLPVNLEGSPNCGWESLAVVRTLLSLSLQGFISPVRQLFRTHCLKYEEVILLSLASLSNNTNDPNLSSTANIVLEAPLRGELLSEFVPALVGSLNQYKMRVVTQIWALGGQEYVLNAFKGVYEKDAKHIAVIVEAVKQQPDGLTRLLQVKQMGMRFSVDAACFAWSQSAQLFTSWLTTMMNTPNFPQDLLSFIQLKVLLSGSFVLGRSSEDVKKMRGRAIGLDQLKLMFNQLKESSVKESATSLFNECVKVVPELGAAAASPPAATEDIEAQANEAFQLIYTSQQSNSEVIEMLKRYKASKIQKEQDIFNCMIHNLFDEYRFFHKYPEKELRITGTLFGSLIMHELISSMTLGIALRYVLEALRKQPSQSPSGKMFRFGMFALEQFKQRLKEWPQYCAQIIQIPHMVSDFPELVKEIEAIMRQSSVSNTTASAAEIHGLGGDAKFPPVVPPQSSVTTPEMKLQVENTTEFSYPLRGTENSDEYTALCSKLDTIIDAVGDTDDVSSPGDAVEDKMHFVINNLTQRNMDEKVQQMKLVVQPAHFRWIANYLVVKRVSTQPNFHNVYMTFLDRLDESQLFDEVRFRTLVNVKKLLRSNKIVKSTTERSLLKNLGTWLGKMTLAKNKPLLQREVDLKEMLIDGYERGWLIAVLPFAAKILEASQGTSVFSPRNPWIRGILCTLAELYNLPELKLNLKFEIEVLCKNLGLELQDYKPSTLLPKRVKPRLEGNPDFNLKVTKPIGKPKQQQPGSTLQQHSAQHAPGDLKDGGNAGSIPVDTVIPNLAAYVHINPSLQLFSQKPSLKRVVPVAVDRAIREIIQPVVERSVTIACITSRVLVTQDLAMEPSAKKLSNAAHLMVSYLAGSLALVTCKEPLRVSMGNHLRSLLQQVSSDASLVEQVVSICPQENLELGCMLIEKAATEKAMRDIDEALDQAILLRSSPQPYYDMTVFNTSSRYPKALPDFMRPTPREGGLTAQQLQVYEAFQRQRVPRQPVPSSHPVHNNALSAGQAIDKWRGCISRLDRLQQELIKKGVKGGLRSLPSDSEVLSVLHEIRQTGLSIVAAQRDDAVISFAQRVFKRLYELGTTDANDIFRLEIQFAVLEIFADVCKDLRKKISGWIMYAPIEQKWNRLIAFGFIKTKLISVPEFDRYLSKLLDGERDINLLHFAMDVVQHCIVVNRLLTVSQMLNTLDALQKLSLQSPKDVTLQRLLDEVRVVSAGPGGKKSPRQQTLPPGVFLRSNDPAALRQQVAKLLNTWIQICSKDTPSESGHAPYLSLLQQQGVLKGDENADRFFRITTELCIESSLSTGQNNNEGADKRKPGLSYTAVDAFSKLVVLLVKYAEVRAKTSLLSKVLEVVSAVLRREVENRRAQGLESTVDQRPYFRVFLNLQQDLFTQFNKGDKASEEHRLNMLTTFADVYHRVLQPTLMPSFAFAWLELVSHRSFMPELLKVKSESGWHVLQSLLVDLFSFLKPFLKEIQLSPAVRLLYKGTLRVLLVLLHDFPEFLCSFHFSLCDVIPSTCIQLRNLILSAFPRTMRLPDPFTPNLKVDLLAEISQAPVVLSNYTQALVDNRLLMDADEFLNGGAPRFVEGLKDRLMHKNGGYDVQVINALVMHVGVKAIVQLNKKQASTSLQHSAPMGIFNHLASELEPEGRYLFLNAIANQLRFPNNHTHYFSCVLLFLFAEARMEAVQEQITRVLLERLIVHRPHPWGLLITFIELIKNPRYKFWDHSFTQCAPEIDRLFDSVARSCMNPSGGEAAKMRDAHRGKAQG